MQELLITFYVKAKYLLFFQLFLFSIFYFGSTFYCGGILNKPWISTVEK